MTQVSETRILPVFDTPPKFFEILRIIIEILQSGIYYMANADAPTIQSYVLKKQEEYRLLSLLSFIRFHLIEPFVKFIISGFILGGKGGILIRYALSRLFPLQYESRCCQQ